jgi:hypothetical protein
VGLTSEIDKIRFLQIFKKVAASPACSTSSHSATDKMGKGTDKLYVSEMFCADSHEPSSHATVHVLVLIICIRLPILSGPLQTHILQVPDPTFPKRPRTAQTSKDYRLTSAPPVYNLSNTLSARQREQYSMSRWSVNG